jgi:DNA topoisomerase-1
VVASFPDIFDVEFTARMENDLDRIEANEAEALEVLNRFYASFEKKLEEAVEGMTSVKGVGLPTGLSCPKCGKELRIKMGKNGHFLACSGYPDCQYSRDYIRTEKGEIEPVEPAEDEPTDETCEKCGRPMILKQGKYGSFLACSGYPECKNTRSAGGSDPNRQTGVACPVEGCTGQIVEKRSRRGKVFYGCDRFPECDYALWDKPVPHPCPQCGAAFLVEKTTKKEGTFLKCINKECNYKETP